MSPTMVDAMDYAVKVGGILHRYRGSFWAMPKAGSNPITRVYDRTVIALVRRGFLKVTQMGGSAHRRAPVRVKLVRRWPPE